MKNSFHVSYLWMIRRNSYGHRCRLGRLEPLWKLVGCPWWRAGLDMGFSSGRQREVTREHGTIRALLSFTLQRKLCAIIIWVSMRRARLLDYWLRLACSDWPAGFISTSFYLSKVCTNLTLTLLPLSQDLPFKILLQRELPHGHGG